MGALVERLRERASLKKVLVSMVLLVLMLLIINGDVVGTARMVKITNGVNILDMQPGYSPVKAYEILEAQGAEGRAFYLSRIIPVDMVFPLAYTGFYLCLGLYLLKSLKSQNKGLYAAVVLPLFAMVFDYMENCMAAVMLANYPQRLLGVAAAAGVFTILKWVFTLLSVGCILGLGGMNLVKRILGGRAR